ncbi:Cuticle protein AM1199 [Chionoecetes opilio]|uniref:Cuticle protein AM1199 n=1 Tax=Chionoecetes opilio TaxID=41210 RepID=A0A8J4YMY4_CHIOP|nr:Cuticle protein AM1199 [Chionoecetes opilio]
MKSLRAVFSEFKGLKVMVVMAAVVASAAAAPQRHTHAGYKHTPGTFIPILVDERDGPYADGSYAFNFETANGIVRQEQGYPQGPAGAVASSGGWSFTFPDGTPADFQFVADENGYRPVSNLIPTPHPLPAHAIQQIEFARRNPTPGSHAGAYRPF